MYLKFQIMTWNSKFFIQFPKKKLQSEQEIILIDKILLTEKKKKLVYGLQMANKLGAQK